MKIRPILLLICAVIILLALLIWFAKQRDTASVRVPARPVENVMSTSGSQLPGIAVPSSTAMPSSGDTASQPPKSKDQEMVETLSAQNDIPIVFYGKLEDQFGSPITGAEIAASVRIYNGQRSTVERFSVTSDANGFFQINHGKGESLGLAPRKTGYVLATTETYFRYSRLDEHPYVPDAGNPTVVKMWKLQGGEMLTHFSFNTRVPHDGTPVIFDFRTGKIVETGGDLIIQLKCPLSPDTSQQYDWQAIVQPVDGGIVSSDGALETRFQAPESGYDSEYDIKNIKDVKPWSSAFHGGFYFKCHRGAAYGKCDLGIVVYAIKDGLVPITIDGYMNPAGSRNLEIAPDRLTEAHP